MAKWRRGGGRRRWVWTIETEPSDAMTPKVITPEVKITPDPFEHDDPDQIRNALAVMENDVPAENPDTVN